MKRQSWFFVLAFLTTFFAVACGAGDKMPTDWNDDGMRRRDDGSLKPLRGWSAAGNLAFLKPDKKVSLQCQFDEPASFTIAFSVNYPRSGIDEPCMAEAEIEWSVAGNSVKRTITVSDGAVVTGVGEAVIVRMFDASPIGDSLTGGFGTEYGASVQVARGTRGSFTNPPILQRLTTDYQSTVNAGLSRTFPVPENAGVVGFKFLFGDSTGAAITDQEIRASQLDPNSNEISRCDPRDHEWVPLAPGAVNVEFTNVSADPLFVFIYWAIDG